MTSTPNQLIEEYLMRLDNASAFLAPVRRGELREEIREHIDAALETVQDVNSGVVLEVLDRLGSPADIVAVELASAGDPEITPESLRQKVSEGEGGGVVIHSPSFRRRSLYVASSAFTLAIVVLLTFFAVSGMHDPGQSVEPAKNSISVPAKSDPPSEQPVASPELSNEPTFRPDESSSSSGQEESASPSPT